MLQTPHLSVLRTANIVRKTPDLSLLEGVVAANVLDAARMASAQLTKLGIEHALAGGLAVGAHGYPRATRDVDFLVTESAFEHHEGGLVTMKYGMPIQIGGVLVDFLSAQAMKVPMAGTTTTGIPLVPLNTLIHLKLLSPRHKDSTDVVELVKAGADVKAVRSYLQAQAQDLLPRFDAMVIAAREEE